MDLALAPARRSYEDLVLATRPVLYVPCQGNAIRELVRGVSATVTGALLAQAGPLGGMHSADFDGVDDKIVVATHASYHPGDTFSVGGWWRRDGSDTNGHAFLHNGTGDFVLWITSVAVINTLSLRRAGTGEIFQSTATYTDTPWMHVIAVKNAGTSAAIYVNGVSIAGTYTNQTVVAASTDPSLGIVSGGAGTPLNGAIAHAAIWNRVLTDREIIELYRAGRLAA